jgi:hypothetical protein
MKKAKIDIFENEILKSYPEVLGILLCDRTTNKNIIWATNNYQKLGSQYQFSSPIEIELITGQNGNVIMPRVAKKQMLKTLRVKDMAEVFTSAWICNVQNNLIDNLWFEKENVFNTEIKLSNNDYRWKTNNKKIIFPKNKTWKDYIESKRLEVACGEAPYITSRYDAVTGKFIPVKKRIGLLDRKLRIINENTDTPKKWLDATRTAYKSTYAYEWLGDSLLLAREAMLYTFIENYTLKFDKNPSLKSIKYIANILSWNVWQMDGLKGVIPNSCKDKKIETFNLFNEQKVVNAACVGCVNKTIKNHNGVYCIIKDWSIKDKKTGKKGQKLKFIKLLKKNKKI